MASMHKTLRRLLLQLLFLGVISVRGISKVKRSLSENSTESDAFNEVIYEDDTFINVTCRAFCNAQWKSDFEAHFQISYDVDFYDFPLHPILTSSISNFDYYCNLTQELTACFEEKCEEEEPEKDWSAANHLCILQRDEFIAAFACLNLTTEAVTTGCDKRCERAAIKVRNMTNSVRETTLLNLTSEETAYYEATSYLCHYQFCQFECQKKLVKQMCSEEEVNVATEFLVDYVTWDMDHTLKALEDVGRELLFPRFCHRLLPDCNDFDLGNDYAAALAESDPIVALLASASDAVLKRTQRRRMLKK